jgi:DNA mismatch repair protein MutS2
MAFHVGDSIHVASVGKGVIREVRNGRRYLVEIKGRSLVVDEGQLAVLDERQQRSMPAPPPSNPLIPGDFNRRNAPRAIDLHGMTTDEAIAAVDTFVNDAILAGHDEVRVIHGRSGGRLKAAVHGHLKLLPSVRAFHLDSANPGVTIVSF